MKPLVLKMYNFGPYRNETIDFQPLGGHGIFLITGETGAGKSTIFDAIMYALYGEALTDGRNKDMMLSAGFSPADGERFGVELTFVHNGETYVITRTVNHRYKQKGKKDEVTSDNQVTLRQGDRIIADGASAVNDSIAELLGITKEQFSQIFMIAQGQFKALLTASTSDRQKIFRTLFATNVFDKFAEKLHGRYKKANEQLKNALDAAKAAAQGFDADSEKQKQNVLLRIETEQLSEAAQIIEECCANADAAIKDFNKINEENRSRCVEINAMLDKAEQRKKKQRALSETIEKARRLRESVETLKTREEAAKARIPEAEAAESEVAVLGEQARVHRDLSVRRNNLQQAVEAQENRKKRLETLNVKCEKFLKGIEQSKALVDRLKDAPAQCQKAQSDAENADIKLKETRNLQNSISELIKLETEIKEAERTYAEAKSSEEICDQNAKQLRRTFWDEQAGILAQGLQDGKPCPVCGSVHHPNKAQRATDVSKEQVEQAEHIAEEARKTAERNAGICRELKGEHGKLREHAEEKAQTLFGQNLRECMQTISARIDTLQSLYSQKTAEYEDLKNKIRKLEESKKKIAAAEPELEKTRQELQDLNTEYSTNLGSVENESANLKSELQKLKFADEGATAAEMQKLNATAQRIRTDAESAAKELSDKKSELAAAQEFGKSLQKEIDEIPVYPEDKLRAEFDRRMREVAEKEARIKAFERRQGANHGILRQLSDYNAVIGKNKKTTDLLSRPAAIARGTEAGRRIPLEVYVQTLFFESILRRAGKILTRITNNRYRLERDTAAEGNGYHGLEIVVYDSENATRRSAKSLSGGESFLASLSLALGLSEEIAENAGGIKPDSLFIDEGFGSLDDTTLRYAMNALNELSAGNRLIGLISHVEELKNGIEKQITVKKRGGGFSSASIVV